MPVFAQSPLNIQSPFEYLCKGLGYCNDFFLDVVKYLLELQFGLDHIVFYLLNTGLKSFVHKVLRGRPGCLLNVFCMINIHRGQVSCPFLPKVSKNDKVLISLKMV